MRNKKGHALLLILIVLVILSILGTALISYSTSNFMLNKQFSDNYKYKYIAEGGINQSYGVLVVMANESGSWDEFKNKINNFSSQVNSSYYDKLYNGELTITTKRQNIYDNDIALTLSSTYKNVTVEGNFLITNESNSYKVTLQSSKF